LRNAVSAVRKSVFLAGISELETLLSGRRFAMTTHLEGVIIEESLEDKSVLKRVKITKTEVEKVTPKHKTPWVRQWTLHTVEIPESVAKDIADELGRALDSRHSWYADFKNDSVHYIVFRNKVFCIDRTSRKQYDEATAYGLALGIPDYQLDFGSYTKEWKR
jgi:hypothetical protein